MLVGVVQVVMMFGKEIVHFSDLTIFIFEKCRVDNLVSTHGNSSKS